MTGRVILCSVDEFADHPIVRVDVEGYPPLAVYRVGEEYYCTADTCTHGQASLADGDLEGHTVVCPFHGGTFDVRSGEATGRPCFLPIRTFSVEVEGDKVLLVEDDKSVGAEAVAAHG